MHIVCKQAQCYCEYVTVSDDITTTADGVDTYHLVKSAGRYRLEFVP